MLHQSRPPNQSDGSTAVTATPGSEGDPPPAGAAGASAQAASTDNGGERSSGPSNSSGGGEPESLSRRRTKPISPLGSLGVFQMRSIFRRRPSSGYFSFDGDSLPSSPLSPRPVTFDRGTQTPSPTGQVMQHALLRMAEAHGGGPGTHQLHGPSLSPSSTQQRNAARVMQAEAIGRELRRIGDDFNGMLLQGRNRRVVIHPNQLPHIHQESAMLLCMGLLLLLIGRIIYLQGSRYSQDHSQV